MSALIHTHSSFAGAQGQHSFSEEETQAFSEHVNFCLQNDSVLNGRHLPLVPDSMDLFTKCNDGLLLCKLINLAAHDAIDERAMNIKNDLNIYQKTENQNLALNAARAIGCQVVNIGAQDLIEGSPTLILGLVWQIIRIQLLSQISLRNFPELVVLLNDGETMAEFMKLHPEVILLRWLNFHLKKSHSDKVVKNFTTDLQDSEVYSIVLHRLSQGACPLITDTDLLTRATRAIDHAKFIGANVFIKPKDICDGNRKLNTSLVAQLFNTCHGLNMDDTQPVLPDLSTLEIDDVGDSREERVFRMWINSLNIDGVYLNNLFADSQDGFNLIKVIDKVFPGIVIWKRVNENPASRYKRIENANYAVELGKQLKLSLINVGGIDIVDGNKKLILAIIWQLMRRYTLNVLLELGRYQGIAEVTDDHIVQWANRKVSGAGKTIQMRSFKDSTLKNSFFLLELVHAIEPRAVDWDVVNRQDSYDSQMMNAKYLISSARKIGACVFLTPEDIVEVKSKMILTFVASLWMADLVRFSPTVK